MKYRDISEYKYMLYCDMTRTLPAWEYGAFLVDPYIKCTQEGVLTVRLGYPWDGPSGPTKDRKENMEPSLWHDALYEAIRRGVVPASARKYADKLFLEDAIAAGMSPIWAKWYYYYGLRLFGGGSARRRKGVKYKVHTV